MLIGITQWHATIGLFWNDKHHSDKNDSNLIKNLNFRVVLCIALLPKSKNSADTDSTRSP